MTAPNISLAPAAAGRAGVLAVPPEAAVQHESGGQDAPKAEGSTLLVSGVRGAVETLRALPVSPSSLTDLGDSELVTAVSSLADLRRLVDAHTAALSGELHRRSQPVDAGDPGLARRSGHRTVENLLRATTGLGGLEASRLVRAGRAMTDATDARGTLGAYPHDPDATGPTVAGDGAAAVSDSEPWMRVAGHTLSLGLIGVGAVDAIRRGVGTPNEVIDPDTLGVLVRQLCAEAVGVDVCRSEAGRRVGLQHPVDVEGAIAHDGTTTTLHEDRLLVRARVLRDLADLDSVAQREESRREERSLTLYRRADGMTRLSWLLDPESAALVTDVYDRATSPRLGGPRTGVQFVDGGEVGGREEADGAPIVDLAERIRRDERSTAQVASDAFVQLLTTGAAADEGTLLASPTAAIRVLVSADTLATRRGVATVEGQHDVVGLPTLDRLLCGGVVTPIVIDAGGQPLDVGRDQRMFTHRQRVALAARDGGCRWPGCERPPSWCEAHHIDEWTRDHGRTDTRRGILLCKHHHLLAHNHGWTFTVRSRGRGDPPGPDEYWLTPPTTVDPHQKPLRMPDRSLVHRLTTQRPASTA